MTKPMQRAIRRAGCAPTLVSGLVELIKANSVEVGTGHRPNWSHSIQIVLGPGEQEPTLLTHVACEGAGAWAAAHVSHESGRVLAHCEGGLEGVGEPAWREQLAWAVPQKALTR